MHKIINLTQHAATPEQIKQGVFDLEGEALEQLKKWLTFTHLPSKQTLKESAEGITALVTQYRWKHDVRLHHAMLGGAPYLMPYLERSLAGVGVTAGYAFTMRDSKETTQPDGSVVKTNVFVHIGFVGF